MDTRCISATTPLTFFVHGAKRLHFCPCRSGRVENAPEPLTLVFVCECRRTRLRSKHAGICRRILSSSSKLPRCSALVLCCYKSLLQQQEESPWQKFPGLLTPKQSLHLPHLCDGGKRLKVHGICFRDENCLCGKLLVWTQFCSAWSRTPSLVVLLLNPWAPTETGHDLLPACCSPV